MKTLRYGTADGQQGDLHLPDARAPAVVCLLHGGFWRMPHGRDQFDAIARDLAARGHAVWNLGYRRIGAPGGGWPGTLDDVAAGIDHLATLAAEGFALDLQRVIVVGHSAGGQLALWSAARAPNALRRVRPHAAAGLAAVTDLVRADALGAGGHAVRELIGGSPEQMPERYAAASPIALLPLGVQQLIMHGSDDSALPIALAQDYARAARAAGDPVELVELTGAGHMDFLDPDSAAYAALCEWLARIATEACSPT